MQQHISDQTCTNYCDAICYAESNSIPTIPVRATKRARERIPCTPICSAPQLFTCIIFMTANEMRLQLRCRFYYTLPPVASAALQSGGQNHRWPTSVQRGYITPAAWGVPTASERRAESEVAHKCARWLHNPCPLGAPQRFSAGEGIGGGPQVGKVAT